MLELKGISYSYKKGIKAVDGLDLEVRGGEIFGFLGPNGAGKSTTIKLLSGILPLQEGEVVIAGKSLRTEPVEAKRSLAYTPDEPYFYERYTAQEYLDFIGDIFRIPSEERKEKTLEYAEKLDMTGKLGDRISSFSHGMRQKLSMMASLIHGPKLLVLDEPLVGLDPKAGREVKNIMRGFADDGGAVFFSTHVLEVAEDICDRVGIIDHGRLVVTGAPDELRGKESLEDFFLGLTEKEGV